MSAGDGEGVTPEDAQARPSPGPSPRSSEDAKAASSRPSQTSEEPKGSAAAAGGAGGAAKGSKQFAGWLKSTAASLEGHVKEIRENAQLAAQELADGVQNVLVKPTTQYTEERLDFVFIERALGLELDLSKGGIVRGVKPGGQGERLQVQQHDRLLAIERVPLPPWTDGTDVAEFIAEVQQRMKSMPRPVTLTFARRVEVASEPERAPEEQLFDAVKKGLRDLGVGGSAPKASGLPKEAAGADVLAELAAARELAARCQAEAAEARDEARQQADDAIAAVEEAAALRADLADLQLSRAWASQEAQRCLAEAEAARAEAERLRALVDGSSEEYERLRAVAAAADEVVGAERQAAAAHRAEAERLRSCLEAAQASAEEARRVREELDRGLQDARRQLAEAEALRAEEARQASQRLDAANARAAEARSQGAASAEEARSAEQRATAARLEAEALASELAAIRADTHRLAAADKLVPELRREVDRLRKDVARLESASGTASVPNGRPDAGDSADERVRELAAQLEESRTALRRQAASGPAPEAIGAAVGADDDAEEPDGGTERPAGLTPPSGAAMPSAASSERVLLLEARVAELLDQKEALARQLNARPIVFQFAPSPEEEDEDDEAEKPGEDEEDPAGDGGLLPRIASAPPGGAAGSLGFGDNPAQAGAVIGGSRTGVGGGVPHRASVGGERPAPVLLAYGAALCCKRRLKRGFSLLRKQKQAKSFERLLRAFTRSMLRRPMLLWLWYVHVLLLWFVEVWRQAATDALPMDPTERINKIMAAQSTVAAAHATPGTASGASGG